MEQKSTEKSPSVGSTSGLPSEFIEFFTTGHAQYDDYLYPSEKSSEPTQLQKQKLRNKRKKKGKKTHRKKKK